MNGRNTISAPNFSAMSKYGDFSVAGFGWETNIFFIFIFQVLRPPAETDLSAE